MKNNKTRIASVVALAGLAIASFAPIFSATALDETWGPKDRGRYTWDSPADHVTFNSITDNPFIGDESNFVRVSEYKEGESNPHEDNVTVQPGKEYEVWIYFHNNASAGLNASGKGLAQNTRIASSFPTKLEAKDSGVIRGSVSATNATPNAVWDTAFLNADETVWLNYVENSAVLHSSTNCKGADGKVINPNALFVNASEVGTSTTAGALIGCYDDESLWGVIPGCNEYAGYITYRVKAEKPGFWMEKTVAKEGSAEFVESLDANPGDVLDFKIYYKNTGTTDQTTVMARDVMPEQLELIEGSVVAVTPEVPNGLTLNSDNEAKLFSQAGLNIGNFKPGETATITYKAKVKDADAFDCGATEFNNDVTLETGNGTEFDRTKIKVNKPCETTPPELPHTGPGEVAMAVAVIAVIGGGAFYLYKSTRALKQVSAGNTDATAAPIADNTSENIVIDGIKNDKTEE